MLSRVSYWQSEYPNYPLKNIIMKKNITMAVIVLLFFLHYGGSTLATQTFGVLEGKNEPTSIEEGIMVNVKMILEGAFDISTGQLMHNLLNQDGLLPLTQPYAPDLPYYGNMAPVWYYQGNESIAQMPANVVDWVLVELRDAAGPAEAFDNTVIVRKACLLLNNGDVVGSDLQPLAFDVVIGSGLYVVVYHRNHLAAMSSQGLIPTGDVYSWDFTVSGAAYLDGYKALGNGYFGLIGGDGDADGQIQTQDKNNVWEPASGLGGIYLPGDFDLNGQVQTQDKNQVWNPNTGLASQVPGINVGGPIYGEGVTDIDGNFYPSVIMGNQEWMAENLRVTRHANGNNIIRYCYDNDAANCGLYGGLYTWHTAMHGASSSNTNPSNVQGICPAGWHLPSDAEWTELLNYVVAQGFPNGNMVNGAGNALKSCRQVSSPLGGDCATSEHPRWNSHSHNYGRDEFGFSALPGGYLAPNGSFYTLGDHGYWWSSTESSTTSAWDRQLYRNFGHLARYFYSKDYGFAVRCVRDN
jgi:uncharacterized protein (TIGR02145 family)